MNIGHRITSSADDPFWLYVKPLGIHLGRGKISTVSWLECTGDFWILYITEDHPAWPEVESLLETHSIASHFFYNLYSEEEMNAGEWFEIHASGQHGYPQPESNWHELVYSRTCFCPRCGIGQFQIEPFRFSAEPKPSHRHFYQLNWVFDELFVQLEVKAKIIEAGITGCKWLPPLLHKIGQHGKQVEQLVITTLLPPALDTSMLEPVTCKPDNEESKVTLKAGASRNNVLPFCGRVKYHWMHRGPLQFSCEAFNNMPDLVKSHEWFGSGGQAGRTIICTQRFRQLVIANRWRGLDFEPIQLMKDTPNCV